MDFISNKRALEYIRSLKPMQKKSFSDMYKKANPLAIDLMTKMLAFNPKKRISVDEALRHPYLKDLHNPASETECDRPFDFEFENVEMSKEVLQEFVWDEIYRFGPFLKGVKGKGRGSYAGQAGVKKAVEGGASASSEKK